MRTAGKRETHAHSAELKELTTWTRRGGVGWGGVGSRVYRDCARRQYKLYTRGGQFNKGQGGRGYRGRWVHPALVCMAGVNSLKGTAELLGCVSQ